MRIEIFAGDIRGGWLGMGNIVSFFFVKIVAYFSLFLK
jgi:hypothetical protein